MKRSICFTLFASSILFSSGVAGQTVSGEEEPASGVLQPPQYVPGQGEEGPPVSSMERPLTYEEIEMTPRERRARAREERRRERRIEKLTRIMLVEGNEFSQEKYDSYRNRVLVGVPLVVLGCAAFVSSFFVLASAPGNGFNLYSSEECYEEDECDHRGEEYDKKMRVGFGMMLGGTVAIAVGIPLIVSGAKGRKRQRYIKRKDEIMARIPGVRLGLSFDPSSNSGGLSLSATF